MTHTHLSHRHVNHILYQIKRSDYRYYSAKEDAFDYHLLKIDHNKLDRSVGKKKLLQMIRFDRGAIYFESPMEREIRFQDLKDINKERAKFGRKPLQYSIVLQAVAFLRLYNAYYAQFDPNYNNNKIVKGTGGMTVGDIVAHGYPNNSFNTQCADTLGIYLKKPLIAYNGLKIGYEDSNYNIGENYTNAVKLGNMSVSNSPYRDAKYDCHNGKQIANALNDAYMYHDKGDNENNGHRDQILSKSAHYYASGIKYNPYLNNGVAVEEFI